MEEGKEIEVEGGVFGMNDRSGDVVGSVEFPALESMATRSEEDVLMYMKSLLTMNADNQSRGSGGERTPPGTDFEGSQLEEPLLSPSHRDLEKAASDPGVGFHEPNLDSSSGSDSDSDDEAEKSNRREEMILLSRKVSGELIASFLVIFTLLSVKINTYGNGVITTLSTSLIGGLVVMVAIFALGHVSGSHINPAVTIAYTAIRHFPLQLAPCYIIAHLVGATMASGLAEILHKPTDKDIILVTPIGNVLHSLMAETLGGFLLLLVASSVSTDTRAIGQFAGLAVGAIIAIDIIIVGPVSGGALNPARALGPAIVRMNFDYVWIYVVGPIVGGLLGALAYRLLRPEEVRKQGVHKPLQLLSFHRSFRTLSRRTISVRLPPHTSR
ncbi:hypothetical protein KP509_38G006000 [Ceratopteris richardii]|uniref:Uncharacterized protein n=1 Tax=Ceratopteris richardii TaxID=49495 RepID=A0A8T2Q1L8_CERRI|nr:hypothetical protein KP509_38G006000 [Ceratopteris richardii]